MPLIPAIAKFYRTLLFYVMLYELSECTLGGGGGMTEPKKMK